jgi:uncharacterized protein with GYD domain
MPKYLVRAKLTAEGIKGTLNEGGTARRAAIQRATESIGGRVEAYYYAFGQDDVYAIFDAPDNVSAATMSMTVSASGIASSSVVVLITPEEMDEVSRKRPQYTPPRT